MKAGEDRSVGCVLARTRKRRRPVGCVLARTRKRRRPVGCVLARTRKRRRIRVGASTHPTCSQTKPTCLLVVLSFLLSSPAAAQDTIIIAGDAGGQKTLTGRILDYNGTELRFQSVLGAEQRFAADQVLHVHTQYGRMQMEADGLFDQGQFEPALNFYRQALQSEQRRWVRRRIVAQTVWCYRALDQWDRAGAAFLILIQDDPKTPHFDCIPLAWRPRLRAPSIALEQAARQWLQRPEPAVALMGASHLLTTSHELAALRRLKELSADRDPRVAQLAWAQTWRAAVVTATEDQIRAWNLAAERIPEPLAAGPYYVLGGAYERHRQWEQAALARLRVAILSPQHRALAAQSLLDAGRALEKLDRRAEALRLYRELIVDYPETTPVAEARERMEDLRQAAPNVDRS